VRFKTLKRALEATFPGLELDGRTCVQNDKYIFSLTHRNSV